MGYYTCYELNIKNATEKQLTDIHNYMVEHEDDYYGLALGDIPSDYYEYPCDTKWYTHEEDMKVLAQKFPSVTFILHGEGEDQGDIWEELYEGNISKFRRIIQVWSDWT